MKNIREVVHDVIEQRVLPWIERDGISNLILPEQITPADCIKEIKCDKPNILGHREHDLAIALTGRTPYCIDKKTFVFTPGRMALMPGRTAHTAIQTKWRRVKSLDMAQPHLLLWLMIYPFGARVQVTRSIADKDIVEVTAPYMLLGRHFSRLITDLLEEIRDRPDRYAGIGRCLLMEFMERCLRAAPADPSVDIVFIPHRRRAHPHNLSESGSRRTPRRAERKKQKARSSKTDSKEPPVRVRIAQDFIHANYHRPSITLDRIADAVNTSVDYFGRQFKAALGVTPVQYLQNIRMEVARELILTDLSVSEVARMVGIEDPYYFSRVFRNANGLSPLKYRRKMAKASDSPPRSKKLAE